MIIFFYFKIKVVYLKTQNKIYFMLKIITISTKVVKIKYYHISKKNILYI